MSSKLERMRKKRDSLREKARNAELEVRKLDKEIQMIESEVVILKANQAAKTVEGGMDIILEILEKIKADGNTLSLFDKLIPSETEKKETKDNEAKTA